MAKLTKNVVDTALRNEIFEALEMDAHNFTKINDRQFGIILTDANGTPRYCRVGVIVAEEREDMTAQELMELEIATDNAKQEAKAAKAAERAAKAKRDKAKREAEKEKKEKKEE